MEDRYKLFNGQQLVRSREVLTRFQAPRYTTTERDAINEPVDGQLILNTDNNTVNYYNGTTWQELQNADKPYFTGQLGTQASGLKTITEQTSDRFSLANSNQNIVCEEAGLYYVHAQQLVQEAASVSTYFEIRKNGTAVVKGYMPAADNNHVDLIAGKIISLAVDDYIQVYQNGAVTTAWDSTHSSIDIYKISS